MGWHMKLVICVQLAYVSVCLTQLSVVREWTSLDMQISPGDGQESRRSILPSQVESWLMNKYRVFVTLYEQREYILAYLDLTDNSTSPLLRPYPSWEAHRGNENRRMIYNTNIVRVDRCDRLWAISVMYDRYDIFPGRYYNMTVFDLKTDSILRNSFIPGIRFSYDMTFDDSDCDNEYVYISSFDGVWTYSWAEGDSWRHIISAGIIASMILAPNSIVYYNVAGEPAVYYMSTTHLIDKSNKTIDLWELRRSRKLNLSLASSALDAKSDVLYYFNNDNKTVIHAVPCWTSERCSSNCQDDIDVGFDPTHELMYITVDENGYLWAITRSSSLEDGEIHLRLLSVPDRSTCVESNANDTTNTSTGVESNANDTTNTSTDVEPDAKDTTDTANIHEITTAANSTRSRPQLSGLFLNTLWE